MDDDLDAKDELGGYETEEGLCCKMMHVIE